MSKVTKRSIGARLNEKGLEVLSNLRKTLHIKPRRPVSQDQQFRLWLDQQSKLAALKGEDTYEEFTDFGVDEDFELPANSPYELVYDPISGKEVLPAEKIWLDQKRAEWTAQEAQKRKAERAKKEQQSAFEDYVTKREQAKNSPKKTRKPAPEFPEDDGE